MLNAWHFTASGCTFIFIDLSIIVFQTKKKHSQNCVPVLYHGLKTAIHQEYPKDSGDLRSLCGKCRILPPPQKSFHFFLKLF